VIWIWVEQANGRWFAVAHHEGRLVACASARDRERAVDSVRGSLPHGRELQFDMDGTAYPRSVVALLARLEAGDDLPPSFDLCPDCVPEPLASVARAASSIPRGYVGTYGGIAAAAGTDARVVGHVMATNPLYPIIPCHRVVGADLALVGYTGSQGPQALRLKLARLRAEAMGVPSSKSVALPSLAADMTIYPVEWVIAKAAADGVEAGDQLSIW